MPSEQEPAQNRQIHICPECYGELVQPIKAEHVSSGMSWKLWLRCPDCEWQDEDTFSSKEVYDYDEIFDDGRYKLEDALKYAQDSVMKDYIGRFVTALEAGQILPEDF